MGNQAQAGRLRLPCAIPGWHWLAG